MRIAICGTEKSVAISKAESVLNTESKKTLGNSIIDYAAETYKYFSENDVIFEGSAFDFIGNEETSGYEDVYEQIALSSLANLDYVVVITLGMDRKVLKSYMEYAKIYPDKFYLYGNEADFELVLK